MSPLVHCSDFVGFLEAQQARLAGSTPVRDPALTVSSGTPFYGAAERLRFRTAKTHRRHRPDDAPASWHGKECMRKSARVSARVGKMRGRSRPVWSAQPYTTTRSVCPKPFE